MINQCYMYLYISLFHSYSFSQIFINTAIASWLYICKSTTELFIVAIKCVFHFIHNLTIHALSSFKSYCWVLNMTGIGQNDMQYCPVYSKFNQLNHLITFEPLLSFLCVCQVAVSYNTLPYMLTLDTIFHLSPKSGCQHTVYQFTDTFVPVI